MFIVKNCNFRNIVRYSNVDEMIFSLDNDIEQMKIKIYALRINILIHIIKSLYVKDKLRYKESMIRCKSRFDWDFGWQLTSGVRLSDRYQYHNPTSEVSEVFKQLTQIKYFNPRLASKEFIPNNDYYFRFSEYEELKKLLLNEVLCYSILN